MKKIIVFTLFLSMAVLYGQSQALLKTTYRLANEQTGADNPFSDRLYGNGIVDIVTSDSLIWTASGYGLSRGIYHTVDGTVSWRSFAGEDYLSKGGVSAMAYMDDSTLWIATAYDTLVHEDELPAGGGLSYTRDGGQSWTHVPQPLDPREIVDYSPTTTVIQNLIYDIAFIDSTIWIASYGGGLRRSDDMGKNWQVVTTDGVPFSSLAHLNHRVFSLLAVGDTLWVGTAAGISKSTDNGQSWQRFTFSATDSNTISGNFVVALAFQPATETIWAATIEASADSERRAVSISKDWGHSWQRLLTDEGLFTHNFAFHGDTAFLATDQGMYYKTEDQTDWQVITTLQDYQSGEEIVQKEYYSAAVQRQAGQPRLWLGSSDGLAMTALNQGVFDWHIFRSYLPVSARPEPAVYAYPSPFSPSRHSYIRFEYGQGNTLNEAIKIYDFAMNPVATIPVGDLKPKWDGRNSAGDGVASGVYFYRAKVNGKVTWGKLVVIN